MRTRFTLVGLVAALLNLSGCPEDAPGGECGDFVVQSWEDCEVTDLNGATCASMGFAGGELTCGANCFFDVSSCEPICGDGYVQSDWEDCDQDDLNGVTCEDLNLGNGTLACTADCTFDVSGCAPQCSCGDEVICGTEECDGPSLGGATCAVFGHTDGALTCATNCTLDPSGCSTCGDTTRDGSELCDGQDLGGESCGDHGFDGGSLACNATCDGFITDFCANSGNTCGNGVREQGEACDGLDVGYFTCATFGGSGTLQCNPDCTLAPSSCAQDDFCALNNYYWNGVCDVCALLGGVPDPDCDQFCGNDGHCADTEGPQTGYLPSCFVILGARDPDCNPGLCGDSTAEGWEQCDGADHAGQDCVSLGFASGSLSCDAGCNLDVSACVRHPCGDGSVNGNEVCDGADLDGQDCTTILSHRYVGGTLACNATCDGWDVSGCVSPVCGDGDITGREQCDGTNLANVQCSQVGYLGGTVLCDGACLFDWTGCTVPQCGDGVAEGYEQCDGLELDNHQCSDWGFSGGTLACDPTCVVFDFSGCTGTPTPP